MQTPLILEPTDHDVKYVMFLLHGLGANKYDLQPIANYFLSKFKHTRFILPQAPTLPVTLNNGYPMPAWFDIDSLTKIDGVNLIDLDKANDLLLTLIKEQQQQGIQPENIILAGFSQGGAVVYHTAFKQQNLPFAGILALSSWAPSLTEPLQLTDIQKNINTLIIHGKYDDVLSINFATTIYEKLHNAGANVSFIDYPMQHQIIEEEIFYIENWLKKILITTKD